MNEINVNFKDGVVDDGYMWVFDNVLQAVCKINLETMIMDIVDRYEGAKEITVGWIVQWQHMLYMVQIESPGILIYDRNKKCFYERFDVPEIGYGKPEVSSVLLYEDTLWIFPVWLENAACCYDLKKGKFYIDKNLTGLLRQHKSSRGVFSPFYYQTNHFLCMVCFGGNAYWKYDLKNGTSEKYEFDDSKMQLSGICCRDENKWFSLINSGKILCCKEESILTLYEDKENDNRPFSNIVDNENHIVYMSRFGNNIAIVSKISNEVRCFPLEKENRLSPREKMRNYCKYNGKLYLIPWQSDIMYEVDEPGEEVKSIKPKTLFDYELEQIRRIMGRDGFVCENENVSICGLITYCDEA